MKKFILMAMLLIGIFATGCVQKELCYLKEKEGLVISEEMKQGLSISEAEEIAVNSECGDRLKETYMCNEDTGSWWIDLDIEKKGCNPACVVNIKTKTAEINWRCTGVLPPTSGVEREACKAPTGEIMDMEDALEIADSSECIKEGTFTMDYSCNADTGTWWFNLKPSTEKKGCNPACVVNIKTKTAEINWRCTGVLP